MAATRPRRLARRAALFGVAALIVLVAPIVTLTVIALVSPYASAAIPASCSSAAPRMPVDRDATVPGIGVGTLLASGADTNVVIVTDPGRTPAMTAYIVDTSAGTVLGQLGIASEVVVAAIRDGVVYLYVSGGDGFLQTDAEISTLFGRSLFSFQHLDFTGIASGCFVAPTQ